MKDDEADRDHKRNYAYRSLDPILRLLLASIGRYQELQDSGESSSSTTGTALMVRRAGSKMEDVERLIGLLKSQIQLMATLQTTLLSLNSKFGGADDLNFFSEYVSLPLVAILSSYGRTKVSKKAAHQSARLNPQKLLRRLFPSLLKCLVRRYRQNSLCNA
jgi:hypothetical protein